MKSIKLFLGSLVLCLLVFTGASQAQEQTCDGSDVSALTAVGHYCYTEPDYYGITVYEMGICTAAPDAPTNSAEADLTACEVVFTSAAGSLVEVQSGVTSTPAGTFSRPPNGTYTHSYMRLSNMFLIKGSVDFGGGGIMNAATKQYCISPNTTADNQVSEPATCSNTAGGTPLLLSAELTDLDGATGGNTASDTIDNLNVYILDSDQFLDNTFTTASVEGILGVQTFTSAITITDETTTMDADIRVTQGMTVSISAGPVGNIDSGPFQLVLNVD